MKTLSNSLVRNRNKNNCGPLFLTRKGDEVDFYLFWEKLHPLETFWQYSLESVQNFTLWPNKRTPETLFDRDKGYMYKVVNYRIVCVGKN